MNRSNLMLALREVKNIQHLKGGVYTVLHMGLLKVDGIWRESCTYQDQNTLQHYTREVGNFKKFSFL